MFSREAEAGRWSTKGQAETISQNKYILNKQINKQFKGLEM